MRYVLLLLAPVLAAVTAAGFAICRLAGWNLHGREMIVAAGACLLAVVAAMVPMLLIGRSGQGNVAQADAAQAGLAGTVIHMLAALLLAMLAVAAGLAADRRALVYWLLAFYGASLVVLVIAIARDIRQASPPVKTPAG